MKNKEMKTVVPKLRFPEFREEGEWKETILGAVCEIKNGKSNVQDHIENGKYPLFDRSEIVKASNNYLFNCEAVILPGEGVRFIPKYYVGKFDLHQRAYALKNFSCFGKFVYYLLLAHHDLMALKAVKSTVLSLRLPILKQFSIIIPKLVIEQQKIADCLSSIDDLITLTANKIEALKAHKKGLMQQLFPAEGEKVPAMRFPEFRGAGEWKEKTLKEVVSYENGKAHESEISETGKYIVVNSKYISTEGKIKKFTNNALSVADKNDILMVLSDLPNGRAIAKCFIVDIPNLYVVNQRICKLTPHSVVSLFLYYSIDRNPYFLSFDDGVKQTNLKKEKVLRCPILLPEKMIEQQKIAGCLSSLDNLIAALSQKLDALKTHKKGLMQQLFPDMNDIVWLKKRSHLQT